MQNNNNPRPVPACASCRHQRKKCTEKCLLAPFFPVEKNREFQAVHKVFGVSNVTKIVNGLDVQDRKRAVDSLVWEAFCRQKDPVLGAYGEFRKVLEELNLYKSQYHANHQALPYKPGPAGLIGLNNNGKGMIVGSGSANNNCVYSFMNNNSGNMNMVQSSYPNYNYLAVETMSKESDNGSVVLPEQQALMKGYKQPYYQISGQYRPLDTKQVDWEGNS